MHSYLYAYVYSIACIKYSSFVSFVIGYLPLFWSDTYLFSDRIFTSFLIGYSPLLWSDIRLCCDRTFAFVAIGFVSGIRSDYFPESDRISLRIWSGNPIILILYARSGRLVGSSDHLTRSGTRIAYGCLCSQATWVPDLRPDQWVQGLLPVRSLALRSSSSVPSPRHMLLLQ